MVKTIKEKRKYSDPLIPHHILLEKIQACALVSSTFRLKIISFASSLRVSRYISSHIYNRDKTILFVQSIYIAKCPLQLQKVK